MSLFLADSKILSEHYIFKKVNIYSIGRDSRSTAFVEHDDKDQTVDNPALKVFVNNTNLTFLLFLHKISIKVS